MLRSRRARRRRAWFLLGFALAVAATAAALAAWHGRALATALIRQVLAQRVVPAPELDVRAIGLGGLVLGPTRLGGPDGPSATSIAVAWTPRSLLARRLARVRLEGLRVHLVHDAAGLAVAGLPRRDGAPGDVALPVDAIEIVDARVTVAAPAGALDARLDATLMRADGARGAVRIEARATPAGGRAHRITADLPVRLGDDGASFAIAGAAVTMPDLAVALTGADATLRLAEGTLRLTGTLRHLADPAAAAPLTIALDAKREGAAFAFGGEASAAARGLVLTLRGRHDDGRGQLQIDAAPVRFGPALQPRDLVPPVGDAVERVAGAVSGRLTLAWGTAQRSSLSVTLDGLGLESGLVTLRDIDGTLRFDPAWPPTSASTQTLRARMAVAPLPEGPLDLRFRLRGERLTMERARLGLAGGALAVENAVFARDAPIETALLVDGVDLGAALALIGVEGLSGSGTLDGRVPVRVDAAGAMIAAGRLAARGPGVLRYTGTLPDAVAAAASEESLKLLRAALADFHYDSLTLSLDRAAGGEGTLLLALKGNNPAVLDGHPFAINIKLEANFDRLAALLLAGYEAADALLRRAARP